MKMLIEVYLDGYETEEQMNAACVEFVKDSLDGTASSVRILWKEGDEKKNQNPTECSTGRIE